MIESNQEIVSIYQHLKNIFIPLRKLSNMLCCVKSRTAKKRSVYIFYSCRVDTKVYCSGYYYDSRRVEDLKKAEQKKSTMKSGRPSKWRNREKWSLEAGNRKMLQNFLTYIYIHRYIMKEKKRKLILSHLGQLVYYEIFLSVFQSIAKRQMTKIICWYIIGIYRTQIITWVGLTLSTMSFSCITATPTNRSSRAKQ